MKYPPVQPQGSDIAAVDMDEAGSFTNTWSDGTHSSPTNSIEDAIVYRHRARAIAFRSFLKKRTHG